MFTDLNTNNLLGYPTVTVMVADARDNLVPATARMSTLWDYAYVIAPDGDNTPTLWRYTSSDDMYPVALCREGEPAWQNLAEYNPHAAL